ncbi:piggyBac transposable element-derived protein 4-like [Nilaparvata lugens]|uniref:piggyBac transposable element-derived protein 4-like n=1 Tax=Nilaparvata lugens TaxID=108931 RepID=UPI00193CBB6A|nr:piggyBac transposable element-derived protein 4-like [Nilaparvata lugens]
MQAFIAVLINMGLKKQPTIYSYWWTSSSQHIPYFSRMFTRNRFQAILQFFHMVDTTQIPKSGDPNYNPCARFEPLVDHVNRLFRNYFIPGKNISIDESIIALKAHTQLKQYMPKKHHRWGIKLWMLCDSIEHYCYNFFVYRGAKGNDKNIIRKQGLGHYVLMKLMGMGNLLNKGYHVFIDNLFSSLKLAKELYSKNTAMTGTIRVNRKGIPKDLLPRFEVGKTKYKRKNFMLMVGFREKQFQRNQVLLLSTDEKAGKTTKTKRRGTQLVTSSKPTIIRNYNSFMGGVDGNDQMLCSYMDDRKTIKFWKKVTWSIFNRMILNAYILYKLNTDKPLSRILFTVKLVEELSKEWLLLKEGRNFIHAPTGDTTSGGSSDEEPKTTGSFLEKMPGKKQKNCCVCSKASTQAGGKIKKKPSLVVGNVKRGYNPLCYPLHSC